MKVIVLRGWLTQWRTTQSKNLRQCAESCLSHGFPPDDLEFMVKTRARLDAIDIAISTLRDIEDGYLDDSEEIYGVEMDDYIAKLRAKATDQHTLAGACTENKEPRFRATYHTLVFVALTDLISRITKESES